MISRIEHKLNDKSSFTYMAYMVLKSKLFSAVLLFLSSVILIRALPKDDYGLYVLALTFFAFFELLLGGTDASLTRFIHTSGKKVQHQLIATILTIKTLISLALLFVLFFLYNYSIKLLNIPLDKIDLYDKIYFVLAFYLLLKSFSTTISTLITSYLLFDLNFKLTLFNGMINLFIALIIWQFHLTIWHYALFNTLALFLFILISIFAFTLKQKIFYPQIIQNISLPIIVNIMRTKVISYSFPLLGVSIVSYIKNYLPNYLFGTLVSLDSLAAYSIFKSLLDFLHKGYAGFIQGLSPRLFKFIHQKNESINKIFWIGLIIRMFIFAVLYFCYDYLLSIYKLPDTPLNEWIFLSANSFFLIYYFGTFATLLVSSEDSTKKLFFASFFMNFAAILIVPLCYYFMGVLGIILGEALSKVLGVMIIVKTSGLLRNRKILISYILIYMLISFLILLKVTNV